MTLALALLLVALAAGIAGHAHGARRRPYTTDPGVVAIASAVAALRRSVDELPTVRDLAPTQRDVGDVLVAVRELAQLLQSDAGLADKAVLVSTTGDTAVRGVVHADLPDRLTLRSAVVLSAGSDAEAPAGGLLHIDRHRVDLVQELAAPVEVE